MRRTERFEPQFVESIPTDLEPDKLYISTRFRTASHLCACGCGQRVVTPIKPHRWSFTYNGECVSLWPSIGRWQLPCQAHYYIEDNNVKWARAFSDSEMASVLRRDARDHQRYYADRERSAAPRPASIELPESAAPRTSWRNVIRRFRR